MNFNRQHSGILSGKILILLGTINCAVYPLIFLFLQQITLSTPMASIGIRNLDLDILSPYLVYYIISSVGFALAITALMTEDSRKAGKLAVLAGVLSGNVLNWICLPLMIIGGVLCYCCARPGEN